jgi:hypothetical protein
LTRIKQDSWPGTDGGFTTAKYANPPEAELLPEFGPEEDGEGGDEDATGAGVGDVKTKDVAGDQFANQIEDESQDLGHG